MPRQAKYDWHAIRAAHVEQGTPLPTLAEQSGMPASTIRSRAATEDWAQLRRLYLQRIERSKQAERNDHLAREASEFDQTAFRTAKAAMGLIARSLSDLSRAAAEWQRADQLRPQAIAEEDQLLPPSASKQVERAEAAGDRNAERSRAVGMQLERIGRAATSWSRIAHDALGDVPTARLEVDDSASAVQAAREEARSAVDRLSVEERRQLAGLAERAGGLDLMALLDRTDAPGARN
jgi:hypothetical protein